MDFGYGRIDILDRVVVILTKLLKIEKVTEQFSSYMNCSYGTTPRTEPIPWARLQGPTALFYTPLTR